MPKAKKIAAKVLLSATSSRMLIWTTWAWIVMRRKALCSSFGQIKRKHYQGDRWESEYLPICDKWSDSSVPGLGRASGRGAGVDHRCRKFNRMPASYGDWSSKKKKKKKWAKCGASQVQVLFASTWAARGNGRHCVSLKSVCSITWWLQRKQGGSSLIMLIALWRLCQDLRNDPDLSS